MAQLSDQDQTRLALACLFAALAQTLGEQYQSFLPKFEQNLHRVYDEVREYESSPIGTMETLRWTSEILKKRA